MSRGTGPGLLKESPEQESPPIKGSVRRRCPYVFWAGTMRGKYGTFVMILWCPDCLEIREQPVGPGSQYFETIERLLGLGRLRLPVEAVVA